MLDDGKFRVYYPDFKLPGYGLSIEYFGLNGNSDYNKRPEHKMRVYRDNGIDVLFLTRDSLRGDWPTKVTSQIEDVLKGRLDRFYRCRDCHD